MCKSPYPQPHRYPPALARLPVGEPCPWHPRAQCMCTHPYVGMVCGLCGCGCGGLSGSMPRWTLSRPFPGPQQGVRRRWGVVQNRPTLHRPLPLPPLPLLRGPSPTGRWHAVKHMACLSTQGRLLCPRPHCWVARPSTEAWALERVRGPGTSPNLHPSLHPSPGPKHSHQCYPLCVVACMGVGDSPGTAGWRGQVSRLDGW